MNRSRLLMLSIVAGLAALSTSARASGPRAATSTAPTIIRLVGSAAGTADTNAGEFTVVVRDRAGNPINGASVVVDFSLCPDVTICSDQLDPNTLINCGNKTVRKFTEVDGSVKITIVGGSTGAGGASTIGGGARIFANGTLLSSPSVAVYDLDGQSGVSAGDLSAWLADFASGQPWARSDYDGDGSISAGDLAAWLGVFAAGTSASSCSTLCP
jgi:hypothetical protein